MEGLKIMGCSGGGDWAVVKARATPGNPASNTIIIITSLTPDKDIGGINSMQSSYSVCRNEAKWDMHGREKCPL